jgi:hypothetical protein
MFDDGFLMVNLWWFEAFSWWFAGVFWGMKIFLRFRILFWGFVWKRAGWRIRFGNGERKVSRVSISSLSHLAFAAVIRDDGLTRSGDMACVSG